MADKKAFGSRRHRLRTFLILLPVIIIVIAAGVGVYIYVSRITTTNSADTSTKTTLSPRAKSIATTYTTAQAVAKTDGVQAGQAVLDKELATTKVASEQAGIYGAKVALADSNGKGDVTEMISFALKADELGPTVDTAALLGELYHRARDKDNAIRFFTFAIQRIGDVSKADLQTKGNYSYYKSAIEAIKNGA